jgi:ribosomal protein S18 acetylase RimI-like enzyme
MQDSDLSFVRIGLCETTWEDIPDDQKAFLNKSDCDRRSYEDFQFYMSNDRFKFRVFVAVVDEKTPAGYISVGETVSLPVGLPMGTILDFWVTPEHRRRGIGSKLLDHAIEYARSQGYSHTNLLVSSTNKEAIRLYERRGFYVDRLTMAKKL